MSYNSEIAMAETGHADASLQPLDPNYFEMSFEDLPATSLQVSAMAEGMKADVSTRMSGMLTEIACVKNEISSNTRLLGELALCGLFTGARGFEARISGLESKIEKTTSTLGKMSGHITLLHKWVDTVQKQVVYMRARMAEAEEGQEDEEGEGREDEENEGREERGEGEGEGEREVERVEKGSRGG